MAARGIRADKARDEFREGCHVRCEGRGEVNREEFCDKMWNR